MRRMRFWQTACFVFLVWVCLGTSAHSREPGQLLRSPNAVLPATLAIHSNDALWLLDGTRKTAQPRRITAQGRIELFDWSPDGRWFAFLRDERLYVVKADGSLVQQVDQAAVLGTPQWSPTENQLVYRTWNETKQTRGLGKRAVVSRNGRIEVHSIWEASEQVADFAWRPGGKCLAISLPRTTQQPLRIDELCLNGSRRNLYTDKQPALTEPGSIYVREAVGLTFSPNGRYLSYFLLANSASLSADGVMFELLDAQTGQTRQLGGGLAYREWTAWSPDSRTLAYIVGSNRMVTTNKSLTLFDAPSGTIRNLGVKGNVDAHPVWSRQAPYQLFFLRGPETEWPSFKGPTVVVPGQRVWKAKAEAPPHPVTTGPANTSDVMQQVAPDGKHLLFVRLKTFQEGSLYWNSTEFVRGLHGRDHGYYGNYLPPWFKAYWHATSPVAQPGLFACGGRNFRGSSRKG